MKFRVKCLMTPDGIPLPEDDASLTEVQEVSVPNPQFATVVTLRGAAVVKFRIKVPTGFSMVYSGPKTSVDLRNERVMLKDTGLEDGDLILLVSKRPRSEESAPSASSCAPPAASTSSGPSAKVVRLDEGGRAGDAANNNDKDNEDNVIGRLPGADGEESVEFTIDSVERVLNGVANPDDPSDRALLAHIEANPHLMDNDSAEEDEDEDDIRQLYEGENSPDDLYDRLIQTVDNLVDMRERFIANPEGMMRFIQEKDPTLYQLIATNKEEFLQLVNDEELVKTLQQEKEMADEEDDWDEEGMDEGLDEAQQQIIHDAFMDYVQQAMGGSGEGEASISSAVAGSSGTAGGGAMPSEAGWKSITPTEEEEGRIQSLVQLGFTYEQCKKAFYICHRSVERAANHLFEHAPQL